MLQTLETTPDRTIEAARNACVQAFRDLGHVGRRLAIDDSDCTRIVTHYWKTRRFPTGFSLPSDAGETERFLLLGAILEALDKLPDAPINDAVRSNLCAEFQFIANPDPRWTSLISHRGTGFWAFCGMALLERFPAGQLDWQVSGIARSWFTRMPWRDLPRVLHCAFLRGGGLHPYFITHQGPRRRPFLQVQSDTNRCFLHMADSLRLQPHVRGIIRVSWLVHADNHRMHPHLLWIPEIVTANGGVATHIGDSPTAEAIFRNDPKRKQLYESGAWRPKEGLLIWPRDAVLKWAAKQRDGAPAGRQ